MLRVHPQRTAVGRELLDVVDVEAVRAKISTIVAEREVREVLVVDRVVLEASRRWSRCGNSNVAVPSVASRSLTPATKSFMSGTCARTLLPMTRRARLPSSTSRSAVSRPKNATRVGTPRASASSRDVCGRVDAEDGDAGSDEVLEEIAVVRSELDDKIVLRRAAGAA